MIYDSFFVVVVGVFFGFFFSFQPSFSFLHMLFFFFEISIFIVVLT